MELGSLPLGLGTHHSLTRPLPATGFNKLVEPQAPSSESLDGFTRSTTISPHNEPGHQLQSPPVETPGQSVEPTPSQLPTPAYAPPKGAQGPLLMEEFDWGASSLLAGGSNSLSNPSPALKLLTPEEFYPMLQLQSQPEATPASTPTPPASQDARQEFATRHAANGWQVFKSPGNVYFPDVQGGQVAFRAPDCEGNVREFQGLVAPDTSKPNSAYFTLDGNPQKFNINQVESLAYQPESSFKERHTADKGWFNINTNFRDWDMMCSAGSLDQKTVSFRTADAEGVMREWKGLAQAVDGDPYRVVLPGAPQAFDIRKFQNLAIKTGN